jgi:hypothetical protein
MWTAIINRLNRRRQVRRTLAVADAQVARAVEARIRRKVAATLALVA